ARRPHGPRHPARADRDRGCRGARGDAGARAGSGADAAAPAHRSRHRRRRSARQGGDRAHQEPDWNVRGSREPAATGGPPGLGSLAPPLGSGRTMTIVKSLSDSAAGLAIESRACWRCAGRHGWRPLALVLVLVLCAPAAAQPSSQSGSWMSTWSAGPPAPGLEPSAWLGRRGIGMSLGGSLAFDVGDRVPPGAGLGSGWPVLELRAQGARPSLQQSGGSRALSARLHFLGPDYGAWLASSGF